MEHDFSNIILIGMAGAGKTTVGSVLARLTGKQFVDTDDLIEQRTGMALQDYLHRVGREAFQQQEEQTLLAIDLADHVIATGGSVIYSDRAMNHLRKNGRIVLLEVDLEVLARRVQPDTRGLVNPGGISFRDLYYSRKPLYERWADIRIKCGSRSPEEIARSILNDLSSKKTTTQS